MSEYKVSFKLTEIDALFPFIKTGMQVFEADSARDAIRLTKAELKSGLRKHAISEDDVNISITNVEAV